MQADQMRKEFEAWWDREGTTLADWDGAWLGWQAGYAAGMERAAEVVDVDTIDTGYGFADAIRAEIKEKG
ncbi:hypothetical protein K6V92_10505 [Cupriavidus respiraculi]|uniref:hypothetical protein n=1 Tax=Cupriavidus respiraculi TaxID=195930 RepID=UPI001C955669|nr:hypothetical protein [Cupriavidus respiraculi]MBY4947049.1 hypothetical protein [Cupriavidus respiraculi]